MPPNTPVRIYVHWHPGCEEGLSRARQIYHWFRLPSAEGIPVYFRCAADPDAGECPGIPGGCDHNIIIPLVDPHMVASTSWRRRIEALAGKASSTKGKPKYHLLPVALHETAYQMPGEVRRLNFIRDIGSTDSGEAVLTRLTEALCLLLRRIANPRVNTPIKIFLSHAKADGTEIPKEIKSFIQNETQCHTFFDENDIAYGHDFAQVIREALQSESAGLLVVQGDHYADRPWCRKEIRDFLVPVRLRTRPEVDGPPMFGVMPSVVVTGFNGLKVARTIPELGHASSVHWKSGAARAAVVTLLREILFSNFYRLLAQRERSKTGSAPDRKRILVNRPPDPVMIEHLLRLAKVDRTQEAAVTIHHPGHGLTGVELQGLKELYPGIRFHAFGATEDQTAPSPAPGEFSNRVLAISVSDADDILEAGFSDDHTVELLTQLLQPLFKEDISLLYGGGLPEWGVATPVWKDRVNFTHTFLNLLLAERDKTQSLDDDSSEPPPEPSGPPSRLFNLSAWPYSRFIRIEDEARWINTCSFIRIDQKKAGISEADRLEQPEKEGDLLGTTLLNTARCLTAMRQAACGMIECDVPGNPDFRFQPLAHLFIGGKLKGYTGIIPGVWEEILHALESGRPCFLIGATRGAAGKIATWLLDPPAERPAELSFEHQLQLAGNPDHLTWLQSQLGDEPKLLSPQEALDRLWALVRKVQPGDGQKNHAGSLAGMLNNGLTTKQNRRLLESGNFREIADLVETGLKKLAKG